MGLANNAEEEIIDIDLSPIRKKRFRVDGDNNRILELNTSDTSIVSRLNEVYPKLQELAQTAANNMDLDDDDYIGLEKASKVLKDTDDKMREYVDYIFDADVSEKCVPSGSMWDPFDGKFTFEWVIERIGALYENNFNQEFRKLSQRMKKHTDKYIGKKKK